MTKLSDILDSGLFIDEEGQPDYRTGKVRQQIKDLMLELVGKNEYEEGMTGEDKLMTKHCDYYRDELREKIEAL